MKGCIKLTTEARMTSLYKICYVRNGILISCSQVSESFCRGLQRRRRIFRLKNNLLITNAMKEQYKQERSSCVGETG